MSIGTTIKRLRRERDITQEQLAEYIGISSQAVSQWECDKTAPDISQLPVLAHVFGVTTDEILGVDIQKKEERIEAIKKEAHVFYANGEFDNAAEIYRNGLKQFPRSYDLMAHLAENLSCAEKNAEAIELCKKILSECTSGITRDYATQTLIYAYSLSGDSKNAIKTAKEQPQACFSREDYLMHILGSAGDKNERMEAADNLHNYAHFCLGRLMQCLQMLSYKPYGYSDEDRIKLLEQSIAITEAVYCDGDYHFQSQWVAVAYMHLGIIYASKQDVENTLKCIEKEAEFRIHFCTYDANAVHTSPGVRGLCDGGWIPDPDGNQANDMLRRLESSDYNFIRSDERFKATVAELKKYAV